VTRPGDHSEARFVERAQIELLQSLKPSELQGRVAEWSRHSVLSIEDKVSAEADVWLSA
jgi:hypothetical protein